MRPVSYTLAFTLMALAGCQTRPQVNAHIDTVNAEYRQLEDYVYCLEDEVARLQQQLEATRAADAGEPRSQPGASRGGLFRRRPEAAPRGGTSGPGGAPDGANEAPLIEVPGGSSPAAPMPGRSRMQRPDLTPPAVELPPPASIPSPPEQIRPAAGEQPLVASSPAKPSDTKITHITLNPVLTGGSDFDSQPGDDGLCVVIEPRNAGEEYVPEAGSISIVVLDPAKQGDASRVARWDFDLSAARQKLAGSAVTSGIKLELPWPATPPAANRLHLFVRYETADGRKLQTDREVFLTPPGQISNRWTPRTAERARPAAPPTAPIAGTDAAIEESLPKSPPASLSVDESSAKTTRPTWSPHR